MAYGIKYRLEFSDDLENGKKIEILKKDYTGSVLPLVGTSDPVEISWEGDDDFYSPIKGSSCLINLFVTENISYDNFYEFNEREYRVNLYYKDASNIYQIFWTGWIVADNFSEAITTKPFPITINALDGLGLLKSFDYPIYTTQVTGRTFTSTLTSILDYLDLDLEFYVSNDIRRYQNPSNSLFDELVPQFQNGWFKDGGNLMDAKAVLEMMLRVTNSRIFQSLGKWYIINNSSYNEQSLKDTISTYTSTNHVPPTGIKASQTSYLVANETEAVELVLYNYLGVYQSTTDVNVLKEIPTNLKPLNNAFLQTNLRPLEKYSYKIDLSQNDTNYFKNGGFEFGTISTNTILNWVTYSAVSGVSAAAILDNVIVLQGNNSVKTTNSNTVLANTRKMLTTDERIMTNSQTLANVFKFNVFASHNNTSAVQLYYIIKVVDNSPDSYVNIWWNATTEAWVTSEFKNPVTLEEVNVWEEFEFDIESFPSGYDVGVTVEFYEPRVATVNGFNAFYIDNVSFSYTNPDFSDFYKKKTKSLEVIRKRDITASLSGVLDVSDIKVSNILYSYQAFLGGISGDYFRPRDNYYIGGTSYNPGLMMPIEEITTQQVMNDYRNFVTRYEVDLYNLEKTPLGLHNKLWVNFGSAILQDSLSCYIDSMTYNVKKNTYTVTMHIPNQNDDIANTLIKNYTN
tara:strand:- start:627 stop:2675 length:2049 start_codon:yes stop_codon:yes gene_type:complete